MELVTESLPRLIQALKRMHHSYDMFLCTVNSVTGPSRHSIPVPERAMVDLCNEQIESEKHLKEIEQILEGK